jgi:hydrogenase maturation protease
MNRALVDRIADAVLNEGYILYPYRPSVKNRQRWTFGGLYPEAFCPPSGSDASSNQTECIVRGDAATIVEVVVRFLHLTARRVGQMEKGVRNHFAEAETVPDTFFRFVETLQVGQQTYYAWQEAEAREVVVGEMALSELMTQIRQVPCHFPGGRRSELIRAETGEIAGVLVREQQPIEGMIAVEAAAITDALFRLTIRVANRTALAEAGRTNRDEALLRSLVSAHTILGVRGGDFVSLLDPPQHHREAAAACRNVGTWPVLVGAEGQTDTMLSSPIILYDYPQLAPESPGDFFDATEIDEMLTLRILTLTDEEKLAMSAVDERARSLLARTEKQAHEQFAALHGTIRGLRSVPEGGADG